MATKELPATAAEYVRTINEHDAGAFVALFAPDATVNDVGREFRGIAAITAWSEREIFTPNVTLRVTNVAGQEGEAVITALVDGNFDRTGLSDPRFIDHYIKCAQGQIMHMN